MQSSYPDIPAGLVAIELAEAAVQLHVDPALYPLQAIYGAAYIFIDRCYVFLDRASGEPADGPEPDLAKVRVTLTAKGGQADPGALRALIGEFANELLSCAWRHQITQDNRVLLEAVTMQAIAGAMGPPSLDDLASFDFSDQGFDDPLGIAMSWEEKHGKKPPPPATPPASEPEPAATDTPPEAPEEPLP